MAGAFAMLFDLDGTIVDSEPGIRASCQAALRSLGHPADDLDISGLIGPPLEQVLADLLRPLGDDRVADAVLAYREHYASTGLLEATLYPEVSTALAHLTTLGVPLFVATSKRTTFARRIIDRVGLSDLFVDVQGSEPDGRFDQKAELIAHVLKAHDLAPEACCMVGDRRHDVLGARANRMAAIGVLWGYGDAGELEAAGAQHIVARPGELPPIAEAMKRAEGPG